MRPVRMTTMGKVLMRGEVTTMVLVMDMVSVGQWC
jgi:hypothetical protein